MPPKRTPLSKAMGAKLKAYAGKKGEAAAEGPKVPATTEDPATAADDVYDFDDSNKGELL
jgi:hypothetical protein